MFQKWVGHRYVGLLIQYAVSILIATFAGDKGPLIQHAYRVIVTWFALLNSRNARDGCSEHDIGKSGLQDHCKVFTSQHCDS